MAGCLHGLSVSGTVHRESYRGLSPQRNIGAQQSQALGHHL